MKGMNSGVVCAATIAGSCKTRAMHPKIPENLCHTIVFGCGRFNSFCVIFSLQWTGCDCKCKVLTNNFGDFSVTQKQNKWKQIDTRTLGSWLMHLGTVECVGFQLRLLCQLSPIYACHHTCAKQHFERIRIFIYVSTHTAEPEKHRMSWTKHCVRVSANMNYYCR